jgi:hypothetical protein
MELPPWLSSVVLPLPAALSISLSMLRPLTDNHKHTVPMTRPYQNHNHIVITSLRLERADGQHWHIPPQWRPQLLITLMEVYRPVSLLLAPFMRAASQMAPYSLYSA